MKQVVLALSVGLVLVAVGCGGNQLTSREERYLPVYERVLSEAQLEHFHSLPTPEERRAYVDGLPLGQQLRALDAEVEDAVVAGEVFTGMSRAEVLLAWGLPFTQLAREEAGSLKEVWVYTRAPDASGRTVGPRYAYFEDDVLVRTRDDTAEAQPFDPVAMILTPFGELVNILFGVVTLPLAPFAE